MRRREREQREKREKIVLLQKSALAVFFAGVLIFIIVKVIGAGKETEPEVIPVTAPMTTETAETETIPIAAAEEAETETIPIAAEAADMEDMEDPQAANVADGGGATVDMSKMTPIGDYETSGLTVGIDVAKWQGNIDWAQVAASGIQFAMVRLGYRTETTGIIYEDPCAKYNLQQAQKNGIQLGAYFYSTAVNEDEAKEEAAWVTNFIAQYPITYPVAYNCEGFKSVNSRQYNLGNEIRTKNAAAFLNYVQAKGYTPMFYAAKNEMTGNTDWNTDTLSSQYKIWVSQYPERPYPETAVSSYQGTHAIWQYTSQGQVPGISKNVDLNVAYFGYTQTAKAKDSTPVEPVDADPEVGIRFTEIEETVTAKSETNLRTVPSSTKPETVAVRLKNGDIATRTGLGNNGWSRVIYQGQTLYAVSSYLTNKLDSQVSAEKKEPLQTETQEMPLPTQAPQEQQAKADSEFEDVNDQVTAKKETNIRSEPSTKSTDTVLGVLHYGEVAARTGVSSSGWSRLMIHGQTVYALSRYLTADMNYPVSSIPTQDNPEAATIFQAVNQQVTPKIDTNLRSVPSTSSNDTIVVNIKNGEVVTRTGIGENGWSRVVYNGQNLYAVSNYLVVVE